MLDIYLAQFTSLIQAPNSPVPLISNTAATGYINTARNQVAGEGECIRSYASLAVVAGTQQYAFSAITFPVGTAGIQGVANVRLANYALGNGSVYIRPRSWEWFHLYYLCNQQTAAAPEVFAQFGQGENGTLWFNLPDINYNVSLDTVCYPIPLVTDSTVEAIPYPWTDAVPYYAAWLGMMNEQRQGDADRMMQRFKDLMARARLMSNPSVMPSNYAQQPDQFAQNRFGTVSRGQAGA